MGNIGAGELLDAYLVKESVITTVDSLLKTTSVVGISVVEGVTHFKYRYLTNNEMTMQPISNWLKGQFDKVIFTSETNIVFKERDYIIFESGERARITRKIPQVQHGMYLISKKPPHILELG